MGTFQGKAALVTGGARGIGKAISEALAAAGCNVLVHARRPGAELDDFVAELSVANSVSVVAVTGDFLEPGAVEAIFEQIDTAGLGLDILVNNAGFETTAAAEEMSDAQWNAVLQVNLTAPFQCSRAAVRRMKGKGGVIVNMSSIHDTVPRKGLSHYCAAKAGLKMLGHTQALEWAEFGIRVVNIAPGAIETDMNRHAIESFGRHNFEGWIPAGRIGTPEDVAAAVRFVCSDEASYITATDIQIDGGYVRNLVRYDDRPGRS